MILILINWLFNGFLLGLVYLFAFVILYKNPIHSFDWLIFGYGITTVFMLIGMSKAGVYCLNLIVGWRIPVASERQKIEPLLLEVIKKVNLLKHTEFQA